MKRPIQAIVFSAMIGVLSLGYPPVIAQTPAVSRTLVGYPTQKLDLMNDPRTVWSAYKISKNEYFPQPNDWTCNASSYIMMYRSLTGKDISLDDVVKQMGAKPGVGAENDRVVAAMKSLGDNYEVVTGYSSANPKGQELAPGARAAEKARELKTLERLLRGGYLVMINFREPVDNGGHYGVLQGINAKALEIADPYYGLRSVIEWDRFDYRTGYSDPVLHGWYVAIRPRHGLKHEKSQDQHHLIR